MKPALEYCCGRWAVACALFIAALGCPAQEKPLPSLTSLIQQLPAYTAAKTPDLEDNLSRHINDAYNNPAVRKQIVAGLAKVLDGKATAEGRSLACTMLYNLSTKDCVPPLAKLLTDPVLADTATQALEGIRDPLATRALIDGLAKMKGAQRIGCIRSLGAKGDLAAVKPLSALLSSADSQIAKASAEALGAIRHKRAVAALTGARVKAQRTVKSAIDQAILIQFQDPRGLAVPTVDAVRTLDTIIADAGATRQTRKLAMASKLAICGPVGINLAIDVLKKDDMETAAAAAAFLERLNNDQVVPALCKSLPGLPATGQILALNVLAGKRDNTALPAARKAAGSKDEAVQIAAVAAIAALGDTTALPELLAFAVKAKEGSRLKEGARTALAQMAADGVDAAIVSRIAHADPATAAELIRAAGARSSEGALPFIIARAPEKHSLLQRAAMQAIKDLATIDDFEALLALTPKLKSSRSRASLEMALGILSADNPGATVKLAIKALRNATDAKDVALLLAVLSRSGSAQALSTVAGYLRSDDAKVQKAAVKALAAWPNATALPCLAELVRKSDNNVYRILALRGYIRIVDTDDQLNAGEKISNLNTAAEMAARPDEKRLVVAALAKVQSPKAQVALKSFLADPSLKAEAELAIRRNIELIRQ